MMKKNIIFFDFDGTIVDSAPGIKESVQYALRHFGIEETREEILNLFIGPPLFDAFRDNYNMSKEDADTAVFKYRENYKGNKAMEKFIVYEGVEEMLKTLNDAGFTLCIASAKPTPFIKKMLDKADLSKYFYFINGASFDESKRTKSAVIAETIEVNGFLQEKILMVGDRENDVTGARNNGIDVLGVLYGYGDEEELRTSGCKQVAASPQEVVKIIMNQ
ncbi:MAG: HAD-IA family hydrolase [Clostridia bacterium]|nr:HAD-IA family hydrolase [Clostridia bacterium]